MMYYNENTILYADGEYVKASEANTSMYGQSLHYGYAAFEGIRSYTTANGELSIFKSAEHYDRLKRSCELINIPFKWTSNELTAITYQVLKRNNLKDAYIRPLVFCGPNMSLSRPTQVHILICAWEWEAYLGDKLLRLYLSSFERPNPRSVKIEAKASGHYVNSIMATTEAKDKGYDEALLLDMNGNVAEGPGANIFFEKDGKLITPAPGHILPGITRATIIDLCRKLDIEVEQRHFGINEVIGCDSAFYCGTAAEVVGIESISDVPFKKHWSDSLGAVLQKAYKACVLEKVLNNAVA